MARFALTVAAVVLAALSCAPLFWALSLSLRPASMTFAIDGFGLLIIDFAPTLDVWQAQLAEGRLHPALLRSASVALTATGLALLIGTPAAYRLARWHDTVKSDLVVLAFLLVRLLPPVLLAVPLYPLFQRFGLLDGWLSLVLVNTTLLLPFVIAILRQAFRDLPIEIEEAAALDGAGPWRTFVSITLPLVGPALAATALIIFAFAWNDYLFALSFFVRDFHTLPLLVQAVGSPGPTGAVRMLVTMAVPIVMAMVAQRYLVRGLTMGAVKG